MWDRILIDATHQVTSLDKKKYTYHSLNFRRKYIFWPAFYQEMWVHQKTLASRYQCLWKLVPFSWCVYMIQLPLWGYCVNPIACPHNRMPSWGNPIFLGGGTPCCGIIANWDPMIKGWYSIWDRNLLSHSPQVRMPCRILLRYSKEISGLHKLSFMTQSPHVTTIDHDCNNI